MTEFELFQTALEIDDPAARQQFLETSCAHDVALLSRVASLLTSHESQSQFLNVPVVEQLSDVADPGRAATIVAGDGSTQDDELDVTAVHPRGPSAMTEPQDDADDEIPLGYLEPSTKPDSLGRLGHYEVLEVVGRGAFGTVLRAFDEKLHRVVAIKVLAPEMAATSPARKRFIREAQASAAIRHEHVVSIYAVEETPPPYLVMEYIPGLTLQQRLDERGPLDVPSVLRLGRQIAEGLAAAHAQDLIHRDIKPGNILLETGIHDRVKITDFGLARAADDASLTQSGLIAGTPMYMAPEQALGHKLDQRADLFSFGSVLYQMVSGRPPFRAPSALAVLKRVAEEIPRPIQEIIPEAPQWLCDIIAKLHAKNPDDRYQSAQEVADLLADCENQLKANSQPKNVSPIPSSKLAVHRRSGKRLVVLSSVAMLLALAAIWAGPSVARYVSNQGVLEIQPGEGLVDVIVLHNDEGVLGGNKLLASATEWLSMKHRRSLTLTTGRYQLNVSTWPTGTAVGRWDVTTAGLFGSSQLKIPVVETSAIITVDRGQRITLRPVMRPASIAPTQPAVAKADQSQGGRHDSRADAPKPAIAPFDAAQAKKYQEGWARHLNVPVEYTNSLGMKFRLVPPGEFLMGSDETEIAALVEQGQAAGLTDWMIAEFEAEAPKRRAVVNEPFYLGVYEVTMVDFRKFVEATKYITDGERSGDGGWGDFDGQWVRRPEHVWRTPGAWAVTDRQPVVQVSWNDARAYCNWLSEKEGRRYGLPNEAQREFAARAGTSAAYGASDDLKSLEALAWTAGNLPLNRPRQPQPVGGKQANAFGFYDMSGNVWEWCEEWQPGQVGLRRVLRGGGWHTHATRARPATRGGGEPDKAWDGAVGFRVAIVDSLKSPSSAKEPLPLTFTNTLGMEFVKVPKGNSWLGGGKDKLGDKEVVIPADFYLGKYEVTQDEWEKVTGENPSHFSRLGAGKDTVKDISDTDLKRFPVESVDWDRCQYFVAKLNKIEQQSGWAYRLPTLEEWEYVCRGGPMHLTTKIDSASDFYFAQPTNGLLTTQANFSDGGTPEDPVGLRRPCPVGTYRPNVLGFFDMHGNVQEWCADTNVVDTDGTPHRVFRGGSYKFEPSFCAASAYIKGWANSRFGDLGLRLACFPSGVKSPETKTPPVAAAPLTDAEVKRLAALPAAEQVEEVRKELMRRNPGFDGTMDTKIEGGFVTEFKIVTDKMTDIAPIRVFNALRVLDCRGSETDSVGHGQLADLTPLKRMNLAGLTELRLTYTKISDAGLDCFQDCKNLTKLSLASTRVTDAGMVHFQDCKNLTFLGLGHTKVSDTGLAIFKDCKSLEQLWVNATRVTDAGLAYFKDCKNLTLLSVGDTKVSDAGLVLFQDCKNLTGLYLWGAAVGDVGLAHFKDLQNLTVLHIQRTKVTDLSLLKRLPLKELTCDFQAERDAEVLRSITTLEKINGKPVAEFWKDVDQR